MGRRSPCRLRSASSGRTPIRPPDAGSAPATALGVVDVLGVPQEVVAPVDGIVGEQLVNGGEAVEYGQDLVVIEFAEAPAMDG